MSNTDEDRKAFGVLGADGEVLKLAMQRLWVAGRILPVGGRLTVVHTFESSEAAPVEAIYAFGLPRDAALRRFVITGEGFRVGSELRPMVEAREAYEEGVGAGHLSALLRTYRDGRVNLSVGNLRPRERVKVCLELVAGVEALDDGLRFRFPFTLAPCYHREARAAAVAPGAGELEMPEADFDDLVLPRWMEDARGLHEVSFDLLVTLADAVAEVSSPSHPVRVRGVGGQTARVTLAPASAVPDRDVVIEARAHSRSARVFGGWGEGGKGAWSAVVPSSLLGKAAREPRRVAFVLDCSGSMQGVPLDRARNAVAACLGALEAGDVFGLLAFWDAVMPLAEGLLAATTENRRQAHRFLEKVTATGGTELEPALDAAFRCLGESGGDVFLLTDGQVSATERILGRARGVGVRVNCLGIGAASQDRFLALLARETGGVSRMVTPRERVDIEALELFASCTRPVASDLTARLDDATGVELAGPVSRRVYSGRPLVVMGRASGAGAGRLEIEWQARGKSCAWQMPIEIAPSPDAETVRLLLGARLITDLDARLDGEVGARSGRSREAKRIEARLVELGREYGLANRALSLVAVVERAGDAADTLPRTQVVAVGMPADVDMESYFAMHAARGRVGFMPALLGVGPRQARETAGARIAMCCLTETLELVTNAPAPPSALADRLFSGAPPPGGWTPPAIEDRLLAWVAALGPDGGLPGGTIEVRGGRSAALLAALLAHGQTVARGAFRAHVVRLVEFLGTPGLALGRLARIVTALSKAAEEDRVLPAACCDRALDCLDMPEAGLLAAWDRLEPVLAQGLAPAQAGSAGGSDQTD